MPMAALHSERRLSAVQQYFNHWDSQYHTRFYVPSSLLIWTNGTREYTIFIIQQYFNHRNSQYHTIWTNGTREYTILIIQQYFMHALGQPASIILLRAK
jgi:hypothetical protein